MRAGIKFLILIVFSFLLLMQVAKCDLSVTCKAGGPYGRGSVIIIIGNVASQTGKEANVSAVISKDSLLEASQESASDSDGVYYFVFSENFDVGNHSVSINANKSSEEATCTDYFYVYAPAPVSGCSSRNIALEGTAVYAETGGIVSSGSLSVSAEGISGTNKTTISNGKFSVQYSGCLALAKRYILTTFMDDLAGKKGTANIIFATT